MRTEFSTLDIGRALKIPRERFRDWVNRGFIVPTISAEGPGTKAIFTVDDAYMVALFQNLIDYGFSREIAGKFIEKFKDQLEKEKDGTKYPETVYIILRSPGRKGEEIADVQRLGPETEGLTWKFDIASGYIDWAASNPKFKITGKEMRVPPRKGPEPPPHKDKNWRNIHMINLWTLRKEVDAALAKL